MVLNDYKCKEHGVFEGTTAICPELGCSSAHVELVHLKAPSQQSSSTQFTDVMVRRHGDRYVLTSVMGSEEYGPRGRPVGNKLDPETCAPYFAPQREAARYAQMSNESASRTGWSAPAGYATEAAQEAYPQGVKTNVIARGREQ